MNERWDFTGDLWERKKGKTVDGEALDEDIKSLASMTRLFIGLQIKNIEKKWNINVR